MAAGDDAPLQQAWRDARLRIVGSLARRFGDLTVAEDAVQDAFAAAAMRWPLDGEPASPEAWLYTTAYRKAVGAVRKRRPTAELNDHTALAMQAGAARSGNPVTDDDLFALVLMCCHPALAPDARIALTLRHVCGLEVAQIAAGFVVSEATMAKRLVRARRKIRATGLAFGSPEPEMLDRRVDDVRTVIYLVFTEGYLASGGTESIRLMLCEEAIWLAHHLVELRPDDESAGLLALLLLQHSRRAARQDVSGRLVPLDEQERSTWDHDAIDEARRLLAGTSGRHVGRYQVEAAIAALHADELPPNWPRIADLYAVLSRINPSPVVEVNRALAVGQADGPLAGLSVLAEVLATGRLNDYPSLHAVHAELLELAGRSEEARSAWALGASVSVNVQLRAALTKRVEALGHAD